MVQSAICLEYNEKVKRMRIALKSASRRTQNNKKSLNKVERKGLKA